MKTLTKKGRLLMILACLLYSGQSILLAGMAYTKGKILEYAEVRNKEMLLWVILLSVILALADYFLMAAATWTRLSFLANGELNMKSGIMKSILRRPLKSFRGKEDAFYLNLLTTDIQMYRREFLNMIPYLFSSLVAILSSAVMLLLLSPWLLLAAVVMAAVPMVFTKPFTKWEEGKMKAYSEKSEVYTNTLKETVEGYETIRTGCGEESFQNRHDRAAEELQKGYSEYQFANTMSFETLMSVAGLSTIVCLGLGGWLAVEGVLSAGMLFAAVSYFTSLSNHFTNVIEYRIHIKATKKTVEKLDGQRQIESAPDSGSEIGESLEVSYDKVSFAFGERQLYQDFSYGFKAGGCYAIVGESGRGKSTLVKLLLKYYDDYSGDIMLSGQDIRKLSEKEIYSKTGVVDQASYLFNASLYENITLFRDTPAKDSKDYEKLLEDLKLTALAERVGDAPLGDFGDNISGGERQRIAVARALAGRPELLIFDEPTASLDPATRDLLNELIFSLKGYTRIVITHDRREEYIARFDGAVML